MSLPRYLSRSGQLALAICAANAGIAAADTIIEETVVWGTKVKTSSIKVDEETLALKQADHISDLLRTIPGVDVGGAHSLNQRITIRSMDDKDLRITIDGANQNTYMYHHMGNLQIHADILQAADIEIGSNSVVNSGLGGAVRFTTKTARQLLKPGTQFGGRLQLSSADNGGDAWALSAYGTLGDSVDALLYHNQVKRDNYEVGGGVIKNQSGAMIPGTDGTVRGLKGELDDTLIKLGWEFAPGHLLRLGYEHYIDEGNYSYRPDMGLATDLAIGASLDTPLLWPTEFSRDTITLNYEGQFGQTSLYAALFDNQSSLKRDETGFRHSTVVLRGRPIAANAANVRGDADNQGLNLLAETEWDSHTLSYGFEWVDYDTLYRADYLSGSSSSASENATTLGVYLQDRIQLNDSLALIPGLRYDSYDMDATLVDKKYDDISTALALEWAITPALLIKLSSTELFKAPEIGEVFVGAGLRDTPNADIKAETGRNNELSLAFEDAVLGADRLAFGFTLFKTDIDDYIYDYAPPPPSVGGRAWKDNIGDMALDGHEIYLGYDKGPLSALLTFSKADSELSANADYPSLNTARIDRQQGDTISFSVDYRLDALDLVLHWDVLDVDGLGAGLDLDGATLNNAKDGFTVHNISARWTPSQVEGLAISLGVDNLSDEYYASQSSRTGTSFHPVFGPLYLFDYEPGRNIKVTASYAF